MIAKRATSYGIISVSSDSGGIIAGAAHGPATLQRGALDALAQLGVSCTDRGEVTGQPSPRPGMFTKDEQTIRNVEAVYAVCSHLAERVETTLAAGETPLILGGDHSISIGTAAGLSRFYRGREQLGLLWIDAHADINSPMTSPSHCAFGMPVSFISGFSSGALSALAPTSPMVDQTRVAWIGLRDVDPEEARLIRDNGLRAFTMKDIDRNGIAAVISEALAVVTRNGTQGFMLSFDLDVCDPLIAPGTGTPKRGGLTFRESHLVMEMAFDTGLARAIEIVELNPSLDVDGKTSEVAISLLESAVGKTIL